MFRPFLTVPMLLLAAGLAVLVACGTLPHPFEDDHPPAGAPILTVGDTVGIVVAPVAGAPDATGKALADAMVQALQAIEVPATTGAGNRFSYRLTGAVTATPGASTTALAIDWVLTAADGKEAGHDHQETTLPNAAWQDGSGFADLAKAEAPRIGNFIEEPEIAEKKPIRQLFVRAVDGAPGDGRYALASAMTYLLKQRGYTVATDTQAPGSIAVAGTVSVDAPKSGQQHVKIVWHVLKPDGSDAGQVSQENDVPQGTLDGKWGEVAMAVALAGADDIVRVIGTVPPA